MKRANFPDPHACAANACTWVAGHCSGLQLSESVESLPDLVRQDPRSLALERGGYDMFARRLLWRLWLPLLVWQRWPATCRAWHQARQEGHASPTPRPVAAGQAISTAPAPSEHRIAIRAVNGSPEFYDRVTGQKFVPRGAALWRWRWLNQNQQASSTPSSIRRPSASSIRPWRNCQRCTPMASTPCIFGSMPAGAARPAAWINPPAD